jgi:hypothetical protein
MPGTLNGKTGLKATMVSLERLEEFDPFYEPVVFEGKQMVEVTEAPQLRLRGEDFGPYVDQKVELPLAAALLLIAKGVAFPVNQLV